MNPKIHSKLQLKPLIKMKNLKFFNIKYGKAQAQRRFERHTHPFGLIHKFKNIFIHIRKTFHLLNHFHFIFLFVYICENNTT